MKNTNNANKRSSVEDKGKETGVLESIVLYEDSYLLKYFTKEELEEGSKELDFMESHPENYKSYDNLDDLYKSLNEDCNSWELEYNFYGNNESKIESANIALLISYKSDKVILLKQNNYLQIKSYFE